MGHLVRKVIAVLALTALGGVAWAGVTAAGGRPYETVLTGAAERPHSGDPNGAGTARLTLNLGQRTICYVLRVSGVEDPTADPPVTLTGAHIHEITMPNGTGPIRVHLALPTGGSSSGCVGNLDRALIKDMLHDPEDYYVNVHSSAIPQGAVRGDLSR